MNEVMQFIHRHRPENRYAAAMLKSFINIEDYNAKAKNQPFA